jgi:hypothetical protein
MSEDTAGLAKRILDRVGSDLVQRALARAAEAAKNPKPRPAPKAVVAAEDDTPKNSEDALDRRAFRKGGFSKAEKRAYAQQKFLEELVQPPKNPPPAWLNDPTLLPKKPPARTE